ncbi:MAG TPA: flagellar hook-associated protein FlgL [Mycobacteriales bacterium]|nr:flagellar hook-associated protein FlgL [Mycobacteriales bacterium]
MLTSMRVTERSLADATMRGLQANLNRLGALQEQLSSGRMISRPSDSPTGTIVAMQIRGDLRQLQQYSRNTDDGKGWLNTVDSALTASMELVHRAREQALTGRSTGSSDQTAREALAGEVDRLRESLIGLANTKYLDRPVFGGTTTGSTAFDQNGNYAGDTGQVLRSAGAGIKVRVDSPAASTYGTGPTQLFAVLAQVSTDLRTNPAALGNDLDLIDTASKLLQSQLSDVGARYNQLVQLGQAGTERTDQLRASLSDVEDVDLPKAIMELQLQQVAYQVALGAAARVIQPSLQDFLR